MSKSVASISDVKDRIESELDGEAKVLTEVEDRFVYSIRKWFDEYREPGGDEGALPDLVVRAESNAATERVRTILEQSGYKPVYRGGRIERDISGTDPVGVIDATENWHVPVDLDTQARSITKSDLRVEHPTSTDAFIQDRCESHDICKGYCPINETVYGDVETFSAKGRAIISRELTTDDDSPIEHSERVSQILFSCATCGNCFRPCTDELGNMYEGLIEAKREIIESRDGVVPKRIRDVLENTFFQGNPYGEPENERTVWTDTVDVEVPVLEPGDEVDVLFFVGCDPSYDDRNREIARSLARVFDALDLEWGILGNAETCAGNHQRALGEIGLFEEQVEKNAETFAEIEYDVLVTADPHSFHSFENEYAQEGVDLDPLHYTQFLVEHLSPEDFDRDPDETKTVTYHDSCYLGGHNDVTAEPRELLEWLPGYEFVDIQSQALCCGGGGGRMWFEDPDVERRPAQPVMELAERESADVLAVACPFCVTNFEEARKTSGLEDELVVRDISELIVDALEDVAG